jgi:hypothetical protein
MSISVLAISFDAHEKMTRSLRNYNKNDIQMTTQMGT